MQVGNYYVLYRLYQKPKLSELGKKTIINKYGKKDRLGKYINEKCEVNEEGIKLIKSIDALFKPHTKLSTLELLGENYQERIKEYIELFPTGKLPNGKYARGNKKNIQTNFEWFFQEYEYEWETILKATEKYVEEYSKDNYKFMRTGMFFIKKLIDGTSQSDLATYCDAYLDGDIEEKVVFKKKVV